MVQSKEGKQQYGKGRQAKERAEAKGNLTALGKLTDLLDKHELDISDLGAVEKITVSSADWQGMSKGDDGEPQVTDLTSSRTKLVLSPSWDSGPQWPLVQPAKPVTVKAPKRTGSALGGQWKTAVVLPDPQIGYWRLPDGELVPFHDARAIDIALQITEAERPDLSIFLGDVLDLAPMGKYRQHAGFAFTVQPALDYAHQLVATVAELSGSTRYIEGNHDMRLQTYITDNAVAAFGVKQAGSEWPVMSVPHLLHLDDLNVKYVGGYPAGATYINERLAAIHGRQTNRATRSATQQVLDYEQVSVIQGHVHSIQTAMRTRNSRNEPLFTQAYSPGCLCRIDGAVPDNAGTDIKGRPITSWKNWQQGVAVVRYQEGHGNFAVEIVPILEGWALHRGQEFLSDKAVDDG